MIAFLALWLCVLSVVAIYYTIPPSGMRPDIYEIALWILSSCVLATSAIIIVVSLVSHKRSIQSGWILVFRRRITPSCATKGQFSDRLAAHLRHLVRMTRSKFEARDAPSSVHQCPGRSVIDATPAARARPVCA